MNKPTEKLSNEELAKRRQAMKDQKDRESEVNERRTQERSASQNKNREKVFQTQKFILKILLRPDKLPSKENRRASLVNGAITF
jgi:uncharacterized membrane protein